MILVTIIRAVGRLSERGLHEGGNNRGTRGKARKSQHFVVLQSWLVKGSRWPHADVTALVMFRMFMSMYIGVSCVLLGALETEFFFSRSLLAVAYLERLSIFNGTELCKALSILHVSLSCKR
jgi:hypothetical protein